MRYQEPPNWVRNRARCRTDFLFRELRQVVKRDVEEANRLPVEQRGNCTFEFKEIAPGAFSVDRLIDESRQSAYMAHMTFERTGGAFQRTRTEEKIKVHSGYPLFLVKPEWNAESCRCELRILDEKGCLKETLREVWEVSRKALTRLFFT